MDNTPNYSLNKPSETDYYNIEDFNENSDIIDNELKALNDSAYSTNVGMNRLDGEITRLDGEITSKDSEITRLDSEITRLDTEIAGVGSEIIRLDTEITNIQEQIGYTDEDIFGVEIDFNTSSFTRLSGAVGRAAGAGFDDIGAFGGRKRCILTDDGVVLAYYGDDGYTETGALTQSVTNDGTTYPVGTMVQVMVEQPRFYYNVTPLKLETITDGKGFHIRKARYYVSDTEKTDFKLHPAFIQNGVEKNFIYFSAYEGSLFDVSAGGYIYDNAQVADFGVDKLSSIVAAAPISLRGATENVTRANTRKLANNRGDGWQQSYVAMLSATQLLFTIEYATMNTQDAIGIGVGGQSKVNTGATTSLGNVSGSVESGSISYRGEENFWGNTQTFIDGMNIRRSDTVSLYVSDNNFVDDAVVAPYKEVGVTIASVSGYISAFGYDEEFDWAFIPSETLGNSSLPVGDYCDRAGSTEWSVASLGLVSQSSQAYGGGFRWSIASGVTNYGVANSGRLVYIPQ